MPTSIEKFPSREEIYQYLKTVPQGALFQSILAHFALAEGSNDSLFRRLNSMAEDRLIDWINERKVVVTNERFITGRVTLSTQGFGFVAQDAPNSDIFLDSKQTRTLLHGDLVWVRPNGKDRKNRLIYKVVLIAQRGLATLIGTLQHFSPSIQRNLADPRDGNDWQFLPEASKFALPPIQTIYIPKAIQSQLKPTQSVTARITRYPDRFTPSIDISIETCLKDNENEISLAARRFQLPFVFSDSIEQQASQLSPQKDCLHQYEDLTNLPFITIDGADAKDFDDAVYCQRNHDASWQLDVAIADVAAFVKDGDDIDLEARERGTSIYFVNAVIPMLPEALSNGLCSLRPNELKQTLVCRMHIDEDGNIKSYRFFCAEIISICRYTYDKVDLIVRDQSYAAAIAGESLQALSRLTNVLLKNRVERNALAIETGEVKIIVNKDNQVTRVNRLGRLFAHQMIEESMLAANVCAAKFITGKHCLWRIHPQPEKAKLEQLQNYLSRFGLRTSRAVRNNAWLNAVLEQIQSSQVSFLLNRSVLRSLPQASYSTKNEGHFGLAYGFYTHFTSPIRRYPDLLVHRKIKSLLIAQDYSPQISLEEKSAARYLLGLGGPAIAINAAATWEFFAKKCSLAERRADECSRDVLQYWKFKWLEQAHATEPIQGIVADMSDTDLYILFETIDLTIRIRSEAAEQCGLRQKNRTWLYDNKTIAFGQTLKFVVTRADLELREIEFKAIGK